MEEVATEGRYPYRNVAFMPDEAPSEVQQKLLTVAAGDILEPVANGHGFELYRILKKVEPDPDDPVVQQQIDQRLLERSFSELTNKYSEPRLPALTSTE